ncbi:PDZ domain-containing protein [Wenzhouxiangella marina]|uniref:Uncharacterized protein n=1 Tax=Wenzhouxiangella marina TaxID=1579979 RepID=A0A0K0XSQ0_9GAMM|nr:PDZ domain-containing protein [Wenzhouxiangella marina]AKS40661.1 hypothetical protein WM2015_274 [Wenzhouxiangella marina]MBB6088431.1 hypothetical protein [Wenzhouxiangella marina]
MNTMKSTLLALCLASPMALAQDSDAADMEQLRAELEQARLEVAEAAQRLARLQRELVDAEGDGQHWIWQSEGGDELREFEFHFEEGSFDVDESAIRTMVLAGFPPRLGVLLGGPDSADQNLVIGVTPGGGAEAAGIRKDDRLISVAGRDVTENTPNRIREALSGLEPGDTVDVIIQRGEGTELAMGVEVSSPLRDIQVIGHRLAPMGEQMEREIVRIHPMPEGMPVPPAPPMPPRLAGLGHDTDLITNHEGLAPYFGTGEGVLVLRIADDNPLNLESGDVILAIDGETVNRPVDLGRILLGRDAGDQVTVSVMRERRPTEVYGTIPEATAAAPMSRHFEVIMHRDDGEAPPPAPPAPPGTPL